MTNLSLPPLWFLPPLWLLLGGSRLGSCGGMTLDLHS